MPLSSRWHRCNSIRIRARLDGFAYQRVFFCALDVFGMGSFQIKMVMVTSITAWNQVIIWFLCQGLFSEGRIPLNANGRGAPNAVFILNKKTIQHFFWSYKFIKQAYSPIFPKFDVGLHFGSVWMQYKINELIMLGPDILTNLSYFQQ